MIWYISYTIMHCRGNSVVFYCTINYMWLHASFSFVLFTLLVSGTKTSKISALNQILHLKACTVKINVIMILSGKKENYYLPIININKHTVLTYSHKHRIQHESILRIRIEIIKQFLYYISKWIICLRNYALNQMPRTHILISYASELRPNFIRR